MNRLPTISAGSAALRRSHRQRRMGISLLEVVFSIGVVMIGLVGIAVLIPFGGALARKGAVADAAAQTGSKAVREFKVRGMANPSNWRWYNNSTSQFTAVPLTNDAAPLPGRSFCLDPFFISQASSPAELAARNQFPLNVLFDNTIVRMPRITLANVLASPLSARQLFVGTDDLIFDLPADKTLGPQQTFSYQNVAPANPLKRSSQGNSSWMATIVPKIDRIYNTVTSTANPTLEYTLSVVVFNRRPVDRILLSGVTEDDVSERVVLVDSFYSGIPAFSGGDITLRTRDGRGSDDLELRVGDWLMFSGQKTVLNPNTGQPVGPMDIHKWYRIVNLGEDPIADGTTWIRDVTVVGPDWDVANIPATQVTIARGVVEVQEKTIHLETSSLWLQ